ncbi:MAG: ABC transporter ATP-binding protein [Spirochaetes bacterium]|nr:ABC transporter ATP-binding protein [Spirochaetota bacterium]
MPEYLVKANNLKKVYHTEEIEIEALKSISFTIEKASFVTFIGPSGSGKSTLLNLVGCLDKKTSGELLVLDQDVSGFNVKERTAFRGENIGFIFQDFNLIPVLTVFENIEYPLIMVKNISKTERAETVMSLLEAVGMADQRNKMPNQISGGQKQRVAIARALTTQPKLVLADEPTANLDHDTAYKIINLMRDIKDKFGTSFVFSTHDPKIVNEVNVKYTIEDGKIKE